MKKSYLIKFALAGFCLVAIFLAAGCSALFQDSFLTEENETGSFTISLDLSSLFNALNTASSRAADSSYSLTVEILRDGTTEVLQKQSQKIAGGTASLTFSDLSGTIKAHAIITDSDNQTIAEGTSEAITITNGGNNISIPLKITLPESISVTIDISSINSVLSKCVSDTAPMTLKVEALRSGTDTVLATESKTIKASDGSMTTAFSNIVLTKVTGNIKLHAVLYDNGNGIIAEATSDELALTANSKLFTLALTGNLSATITGTYDASFLSENKVFPSNGTLQIIDAETNNIITIGNDSSSVTINSADSSIAISIKGNEIYLGRSIYAIINFTDSSSVAMPVFIRTNDIPITKKTITYTDKFVSLNLNVAGSYSSPNSANRVVVTDAIKYGLISDNDIRATDSKITYSATKYANENFCSSGKAYCSFTPQSGCSYIRYSFIPLTISPAQPTAYSASYDSSKKTEFSSIVPIPDGYSNNTANNSLQSFDNFYDTTVSISTINPNSSALLSPVFLSTGVLFIVDSLGYIKYFKYPSTTTPTAFNDSKSANLTSKYLAVDPITNRLFGTKDTESGASVSDYTIVTDFIGNENTQNSLDIFGAKAAAICAYDSIIYVAYNKTETTGAISSIINRYENISSVYTETKSTTSKGLGLSYTIKKPRSYDSASNLENAIKAGEGAYFKDYITYGKITDLCVADGSLWALVSETEQAVLGRYIRSRGKLLELDMATLAQKNSYGYVTGNFVSSESDASFAGPVRFTNVTDDDFGIFDDGFMPGETWTHTKSNVLTINSNSYSIETINEAPSLPCIDVKSLNRLFVFDTKKRKLSIAQSWNGTASTLVELLTIYNNAGIAPNEFGSLSGFHASSCTLW